MLGPTPSPTRVAAGRAPLDRLRGSPGLATARRWVRHHRRTIAAVLAACSVLAAVQAVQPNAVAGPEIVVAARDLPAGTELTADDLRLAGWLPGSQPDGTGAELAVLVGRTLAAPLRRGEPVSDVRLLTSDLLSALGEEASGGSLVAAPVRVSDAGAAALLSPGAIVDVIAADGQGEAEVVAAAVRVVTVPDGDAGGLWASDFGGALIVLAVSSPVATQLAAAAAVGPLSVVLRP